MNQDIKNIGSAKTRKRSVHLATCIGIALAVTSCTNATTNETGTGKTPTNRPISASNNLYRQLISVEYSRLYTNEDYIRHLCVNKENFRTTPPASTVINSIPIGIPVSQERTWTEDVVYTDYKEEKKVIQKEEYGVKLEPEEIIERTPYTVTKKVERREVYKGICRGIEYILGDTP